MTFANSKSIVPLDVIGEPVTVKSELVTATEVTVPAPLGDAQTKFVPSNSRNVLATVGAEINDVDPAPF